MIAKHERLIADAAKQKVQVLGLQELFYGPYFCAEQQTRWYELTERVPNGATIARMQKLAKKHQMVLVVPIYEVEMTGVYYNTAAVIDADGAISENIASTTSRTAIQASGKNSISRRATRGIPSSRHATRALVCTSATTALSRRGAHSWAQRSGDCLQSVGHGRRTFEYLWELEQPAHAVANAYSSLLSIASGRNSVENRRILWQKLLLNPYGKIVAQASRDKDELLVADLNLDEIQQVRDTWQFYRDRRPESYGEITRTRAAETLLPRIDRATKWSKPWLPPSLHPKPAAISLTAAGLNLPRRAPPSGAIPLISTKLLGSRHSPHAKNARSGRCCARGFSGMARHSCAGARSRHRQSRTADGAAEDELARLMTREEGKP